MQPPGMIPALVDGDATFFEPSALCLVHLADRFPEKLLAPPPASAERGAYLHWLAFAEGVLEPAVLGFTGTGCCRRSRRRPPPSRRCWRACDRG